MSLQWGQVIYPAFDKNNKQETMERLHFGHDPFSKEEAGRFSCAVLSKEDGALDDRIAVVASNKRSYAGHPEQEHLCHCRLVSVPMSRMELPCVRREVPPQQPEDSFINSDLDRSQVNQLTRTFGSKRSIRRSEIGLKVEQHTVDNKDELERTVLGIRQEDIIKGGDLSGGDSTILSILPPHDRSATQLSDIYKVEGLLSREEMNSLEAAAQFFIDNPPAKRDEE
ncbi:hypothetical protein AAG570_006945 [Ranatra chinensis]|uniref:Uncharacterized protein n=1 Tax=Ranatra chinensis TaxID=642074 RepID=A0ABD0YVJ2_9HEMI